MLKPSPSISEIADALFPSSIREDARFVTVFTTYLDASRDDGDSDAYVLSGFISDAERWKVFDAKWQDVLDKYEVDGPFHMTDFESCYGVFKDWERDDPRKAPLLTELFTVAEEHTVGSVGHGVSQTQYDALVPPHLNDRMGGSPYYLLFMTLVSDTELLMDTAARSGDVPADWQMIYVLARGDRGSGAVLKEWMDDATAETRLQSRTLRVFYARDNTYPPLQLADILAFEGRKQVGAQRRHHTRPVRRSFLALEKLRLPHRWAFYDHEIHLAAIVQGIQNAIDTGAASERLNG